MFCLQMSEDGNPFFLGGAGFEPLALGLEAQNLNPRIRPVGFEP